MFGRFQVTCGEHVIVSPDSRNSKVIQLLQYLLCNRGKMILQEELIEVLLHDDYGSNPVSTLKNIVYRLRKLFIGADLDKSCILYKKNRYGFSPDIPCEIDAEQFFELTKRVKHAHLDDDSRFALCMQAIELYRSDFLTRSSNEPWVMGRAVRYQEQFCELIRTAYGIAERCGRFDEVLPVLQRATVLYPYEEELYLMHISCLYELRRGREAIEEYNSVANTLYNDLGVSPSQTMQNLYRRITSSMQPVTDSILEVRATISEPEYFTGAYYCNFENFVNIYQFIVRHMERSGQSVYLMLCTLTESDNSPPQKRRAAEQALHRPAPGGAHVLPARGRVHPIQPVAVFAHAHEYQPGKLPHRCGPAAVQFLQTLENYQRAPKLQGNFGRKHGQRYESARQRSAALMVS